MSKAKRDIRRRAMREMIVHSFFDWKSAVVLALAILMTAATLVLTMTDIAMQPLALSPWWAVTWPVFGLFSEIALAWSNLNDPEFGRKVVADMLREEFNPRRLQSRDLRQWINRALDYRTRIETNIRETRDGMLKDHLLDAADEIEQWIQNAYEIGIRLDRYQSDPVIKRDRQSVPVRITNLKNELAQERNPAVRAQIETTLKNKRTQLDHLERLDSAMQRAQLQLESTLSALGTVYSQTLLVGAKDIDSGRAKRLRHDIAEQVVELEDLLTAMDEVYIDSAVGP
jgi:hypothetical protein